MARLLLLPMLAVTLPAEASEAPETCATAWVLRCGTGWTGPTCCDSGFGCSQMNSWYSHCVPNESISEVAQSFSLAASEKVDEECYHMFNELSFNTLVESFPANPDGEANAYVDYKLCGMQCKANVFGGRTQLVASHLHLASDGDGENGSGPPVNNFCGDSGPGMIADGSSYKSPCAHHKNRAAGMSMTGFVDEQNAGFALGSWLKDTASNPSSVSLRLPFHCQLDALAGRGQGSGGNVSRRDADELGEVGLCARGVRAGASSRLSFLESVQGS